MSASRTVAEDTIAAIATPMGTGAIGIVRLSGPDAIPILGKAFVSSRGAVLSRKRRGTYHGEIRDAQGAVDEVLVHVMPGPNSYTCEDVVEINCHGGPGPVRAVLEAMLEHGARLAEPGEFTRRAFLNGRIDLVQAEAVIDRIQAGTRAALCAAASAASGQLSRTIHAMRDTLASALARIEAAVDFPEEDLPELVNEALHKELEGVLARMRDLIETSRAGRLYREGVSVTIAGRPNAGKSSLFNALLRDARAIVTAQPGTTRDLIEETITIAGVPVRLRDTAGLRPARDEAERLGVAMAHNAIDTGDAVLLVADAAAPANPEDEALARGLLASGKPVILVLSKVDLCPHPALPAWAEGLAGTVLTSAVTGAGIKELEQALAGAILGGAVIAPEQVHIARIHQRDSLRRAAAAVDHLLSHFDASPEFLSVDLRAALSALGEITGETTPEEILDRIFSKFCIGK